MPIMLISLRYAPPGGGDRSEFCGKFSDGNSISSYEYDVIPLFVLMNILVSVADLDRDAFLSANAFLGRIKGGLGVATVGANALFATVTGVSIVSASVFAKVAVPEMLRLGYRPRFAVGVVAGSSVLGMLIPPSLLFIVYGLLAEQSIGQLFIAGILPGIVLAVVFALMIVVGTAFLPSWIYKNGATAQEGHAALPLLAAALNLLPLVILAAVVVGGMYAGWFTPTEAGATGVAAALILAIWRRKLSWKGMWRILAETGQVTTSRLFVVIAATLYTRLVALSGIPGALNGVVGNAYLSFFALLFIYAIIIVLLGTMIDAVLIMLIMVPMFLPLVSPFNVDFIWFGVITVLACEIGLITPPFGLSAFAISSTLGDSRISLNDIFIGALPFAAAMFAVLVAIILFPPIATALL